MKKSLLLFVSVLFFGTVFSQTSADVAVQLSANVQLSPAQITLNWAGNASSTQYQVFRKLKEDAFWGTAIATLAGTINQYIDNTVSVGTNYEYAVRRIGTTYNGYGYINSGIQVPEVSFRGRLLLIVDSTYVTSLAPELERLIKDIEGDGWEVSRHDVLRTGSVTHVKDVIVTDFNEDSANTKAVFLFGHVPVPYSGNTNPDGHTDHKGAWPADCYYADIDGIWTDVSVNVTTPSPARTHNIPGDGKFDQSLTPTELELQVGRVDFNAMSTFTLSELQLLKNYLDKDHEYRKKIYVPIKQAVMDDNFGYFSGEAFAGSGYKNFAPLVSAASVTVADYFTAMSTTSFQWSYGCGGGSFTSAGGIGTTTNFAASNLQGVFTMLFGSYFGDWDANNNFLRAALAQGKVLTNVWSGRPHYQFHHMGLGENIGYDVKLTQNNPGSLYYASPTGITGRWVHNALMGDPTLRNDIVAPVSNVVATKSGYDCVINWSASTETNIAGYNLYMKNDSNTRYKKLNSTPITGTTFTDLCLKYKGIYSYMVRVLKLETTPSGTYYNMSEGIADTANNTTNIKTHAAFTSTLNAAQIDLTNSSVNGSSYFWDFGNGQTSTLVNPSVTYTVNTSFLITLISTNACDKDTAYEAVTIAEVGLKENVLESDIRLFPNPSSGTYNIQNDRNENMDVFIYNLEGKRIANYFGLKNADSIDMKEFGKGLYFVRINIGEEVLTKKLVLE
jgi:hypothetical protein